MTTTMVVINSNVNVTAIATTTTATTTTTNNNNNNNVANIVLSASSVDDLKVRMADLKATACQWS